ncbi:MAG: GNAT family N-acetyltransferase [Pyrinomonadaceae bacterium]
MSAIRPANADDVAAICRFDHIAQADTGARREFVVRSVAAGSCYVLVADKQVVAYGVLDYSFYACGFIAMLLVDARYRRRGYGLLLLRHMESVCRTPKLFTSTSLSNLPMQSLLNKLGYALSGVIHNLDENDPELVYYKLLG